MNSEGMPGKMGDYQHNFPRNDFSEVDAGCFDRHQASMALFPVVTGIKP